MKSLFRFLFWAVGIIAVGMLAIGAYSVHRAEMARQTLNDDQIKERTKTCAERSTEAQPLVKPWRDKELRTTDPRVFYSPRLNRCLYTFLVINPKLPDATTFNQYFIYDLDRNQPLFLGEGVHINTWAQYLEKIAELEQK